MTLTVDSRRLTTIVLVVVTLVLFTVAYLLGTSRTNTAIAAPAAASGSPTAAPGITVGGTGKVTGTPNTLRVDLGVSTHATNVSDALRSANSAATSVQKSLQEHGVADKDIQTSGLSIQPDYVYSKDQSKPNGYVVSESVTAVLHDVDKAGGAIGAAADAGGNAIRVNSVSLDLENTSSFITNARSRAFDNAKAKAEQYAAAAGRSLGAVISIDETVTGPTPQAYDGRAYMAQATSAVPIQAGSQDVAVSVTVVFAFA